MVRRSRPSVPPRMWSRSGSTGLNSLRVGASGSIGASGRSGPGWADAGIQLSTGARWLLRPNAVGPGTLPDPGRAALRLADVGAACSSAAVSPPRHGSRLCDGTMSTADTAPFSATEIEVGRLRQLQRDDRHADALRGAQSLLLDLPENRDLLLIAAISSRSRFSGRSRSRDWAPRRASACRSSLCSWRSRPTSISVAEKGAVSAVDIVPSHNRDP